MALAVPGTSKQRIIENDVQLPVWCVIQYTAARQTGRLCPVATTVLQTLTKVIGVPGNQGKFALLREDQSRALSIAK